MSEPHDPTVDHAQGGHESESPPRPAGHPEGDDASPDAEQQPPRQSARTEDSATASGSRHRHPYYLTDNRGHGWHVVAGMLPDETIKKIADLIDADSDELLKACRATRAHTSVAQGGPAHTKYQKDVIAAIDEVLKTATHSMTQTHSWATIRLTTRTCRASWARRCPGFTALTLTGSSNPSFVNPLTPQSPKLQFRSSPLHHRAKLQNFVIFAEFARTCRLGPLFVGVNLTEKSEITVTPPNPENITKTIL
jgi:hypothetical protein